MRNKATIAVVALVLTACLAIGGTLAWLIDETDAVQNTFTYGDINIELAETTGTEYKMVPGNDISKDPKVTVKAGSEACWLFVEIVEGGSVSIGQKTYTFDDFLTYAIAAGWTAMDASTVNADGGVNGNDTVVIYRQQAALTAEGVEDVTFNVLAGDDTDTYKNGKVSVKSTVTKEMMNAIDGINADESVAESELEARPTLTFTAYAVQSDNVDDVTTAWNIAKGTNN